MNRIEHLIAHPHDVQKSDIPLLKNEIEKHPYFYSLRALLLYGLKHENHPSFEDQLHQSSIYSNNRVDLYHYLNSNPLNEQEQIQRIHAASALFTEVESIPLPHEEILNTPSELMTTMQENEKQEIDEDIPTGEVENTSIVKTSILDENLPVNSSISSPFIANGKNEINESTERNNNTEEFPDKPIADCDKNQSILMNKPNGISKDIQEHIKDDPTITTESTPVAKDGITFSFNDWLKHAQPSSDENLLETTEKEIKYQLIDDFLERNPKISPLKKNDPSPNTVSVNFQQNSEEYSDLMTETLAQIYIEQKKYDKAIKAYKILSLKYPEKNSLFANRIKEIEKFKNTKS